MKGVNHAKQKAGDQPGVVQRLRHLCGLLPQEGSGSEGRKGIRHCPVKAIRFSGNQAHIVGNECILCGQCELRCPDYAIYLETEEEGK